MSCMFGMTLAYTTKPHLAVSRRGPAVTQRDGSRAGITNRQSTQEAAGPASREISTPPCSAGNQTTITNFVRAAFDLKPGKKS